MQGAKKLPRVLLINPGKERSESHDTIYPPVALLGIAAVLRDAGVEVQIKDYDRVPPRPGILEKDLQDCAPQIVGISVLTGPQLIRAKAISDFAKGAGLTVVWGGPHPTILPEETLDDPSVDAVVMGEGEMSFLNLIRYFAGERHVPLFNCGLKEGGKKTFHPPAGDFADINSFPLPAWDLLENMDRYCTRIDEWLRHSPRLHIKMNITRSCVFRCAFCFQSNPNVRRFLGPYRVLHPEKVLQQIQRIRSLASRPVTSFDFIDMLTLYQKDHIHALSRALGSFTPKIEWYGSSRYRALDDGSIEALRRGGCRGLFFGVETGSPRIAKLINKKIDFARAAEITRKLSRAGIHSLASYIIGFPTETRDEAEETLQAMGKIPSTLNHCNVFVLLPGTPLYQFCLEQGLFKPPRSLQEWVDFLSTPGDINVSKIESEVLFPLARRTARNEYFKFFFRYQKDYLLRGHWGSFFISLFRNKLIRDGVD